jgi:hypothetical protein
MEYIIKVLAEENSDRYNYHMSSTPFPLLKQLAMQKWKHEHVYQKVGDEKSTDGFPLGKEGRKIFLGIKIWPLVSAVVVAGLMTASVIGIVWWPALIQAAQPFPSLRSFSPSSSLTPLRTSRHLRPLPLF